MVRLALKKLLSQWGLDAYFETLKKTGIKTTEKLLRINYSELKKIMDNNEDTTDYETMIDSLKKYKQENVSLIIINDN